MENHYFPIWYKYPEIFKVFKVVSSLKLGKAGI